MFTEGLDDKAICWVKQGSEVAQNPGSPMIEKCPLGSISNTPLMHKNSTFLSPKVLPPVKFHSGFLGLEPRTYAEDSEDESVSVASVSGGHHAYYSDTFEEDGWESSDASFSVRRTNQCLEEENIARFESATVSSRGTRSALRHTLVRGLSKENLKVEIPINDQYMGFHDSNSSLQNDCMLKRFEELGTPSAPPIVDTGREEGYLGENAQANLVSFERSSGSKHHMHCTNDTTIRDVEEDETCSWQNRFSNQSKSYYASAETSWQAFVAYDACFRLCLNAWTRDCTEALEFLGDECMMLRDAFGIQKYLLQPRGHVRGECMPINNAEVVCATKDGKAFEKIEVEVRKIKITPQRRKLQSTFSTPTLAMHAGTEYVRHVANVLWNHVNALKQTSFPDSSEGALSCLFQLKHFNEVALADSSSSVLLTPGTTDSYVFYPESQEEVLFFQVQNVNKVNLGHGRIPVSLLVSEAQQGCKLKWWPIYLEEQGCVGKIQLSINISGCSDKINKGGHAVETIIYDLVVEASMRANNFSSKNLRIHGLWEWLLDEFAEYYGVTPAYKNLRYLSHVMNIAVPAKECLELIHDLLVPVLKARSEKILTIQERSILFDCEEQIKNLLAVTFQNYKSLDKHSSTGLATMIGSIPETASPALPPAVKLFNLLHDILTPEFESGIEEEEMSMVARIEVLEENLRGMNEEELELSKVDGVGSIGSEKELSKVDRVEALVVMK
ncbi:hypothetical protein HPP92_003828 [Vanilla planifolia]|uniref:Uncharacterized protein n=1 Tax=Vanilla planifolia TaxID=51239 RepID=A0A835S7X8_VANPL|nr:hypothetical protein HPP92_003828 [Vanilla planifolia]